MKTNTSCSFFYRGFSLISPHTPSLDDYFLIRLRRLCPRDHEGVEIELKKDPRRVIISINKSVTHSASLVELIVELTEQQ